MASSIRRGLLIAGALAASGCASNQFSGTRTVAAGSTLANARLQVYSFLDLRDVEFGPNMLGEVDRQLADALAQSSVAVQILRFKNSEPGKYFSSTNSGVRVPVRETIESNSAAERSFAATHRLIIFPSKMTLSGAWKFYDVRWELLEAGTGKLLWTTTSQGKHLNAWKNDEDPQARAKTIVDGVIAELRSSKLL